MPFKSGKILFAPFVSQVLLDKAELIFDKKVSLETSQCLVVTLSNEGKINFINIANVETKSNNKIIIYDEILSVYQGFPNSKSRSITIFSLSATPLLRFKFDDGKIIEYCKIENNSTKNFASSILQQSNNIIFQKKSSSEVCIDWYLVTTFYWPDGTTTVTRQYLYSSGSCNESLEPPGESQENVTVMVDEVKDSITNPCMDSALIRITTNSVKNYILDLYNRHYTGNGATIDIVFKEASSITNPQTGNQTFGSSNLIAATQTWEISLNNSYANNANYNMSQEAWGTVLVHEILHLFITTNPGIFTSPIPLGTNDHLIMFKNFVNPMRDLLINCFGISLANATKLALSGLRDNWQYTDFETISLNAYGFGLNDIDLTFDDYTKGNAGIKCGK